MSVTALAVTSVPASAVSSQINAAPAVGTIIINATSGKCLTNGGSLANSAPITQFTCASGTDNNQRWRLPGGVETEIINVTSGKCLTNGGSLANSAPITQFTCNGSTNQLWELGGGQIKNVTSGKCMTNGGSLANSAPITQFTCNGSNNQQWG